MFYTDFTGFNRGGFTTPMPFMGNFWGTTPWMMNPFTYNWNAFPYTFGNTTPYTFNNQLPYTYTYNNTPYTYNNQFPYSYNNNNFPYTFNPQIPYTFNTNIPTFNNQIPISFGGQLPWTGSNPIPFTFGNQIGSTFGPTINGSIPLTHQVLAQGTTNPGHDISPYTVGPWNSPSAFHTMGCRY